MKKQLTETEIQLCSKIKQDPKVRLKQNFFNSPIQDPRQKSNEIESNESKKLKFTQVQKLFENYYENSKRKALKENSPAKAP